MQVLGTGVDYETGAPLVETMAEEVFAERIAQALAKQGEALQTLAQVSAAAVTFRGEVERQRTPDLGDPREVGWTFLVNEADPRREALAKALRPLAVARGMQDPAAPLLFHGEGPEEWFDWLLDNYTGLAVTQAPHYVLIVGGPGQVPFAFQSLLSSAAAVGRVDFARVEELEAYVAKVLALEAAAAPAAEKRALFFAPDAGPEDATYYSRRYMAAPLADRVEQGTGLAVQRLLAADARKGNLLQALHETRPALLYAAGHGAVAPAAQLKLQRKVNGALVCQAEGAERPPARTFTARDVPADAPFLPGGVFFHFGCFGYGTPAESDVMHWLGRPGLNAYTDFVAALPRRLLAHPEGPLAYVGHVDTAWLHGFADPEAPQLAGRWQARLAPFKVAVDQLLGTQPVGLALRSLCKRYDVLNAQLAATFNRMQQGRLKLTPGFKQQLANAFITRGDAQNYMVFGDPAVRLRVPE